MHSDHPILTKIIATVGPACDTVDALVRLIEEGARVFRINFSHGSFADFERMFNNIREAGEHFGEPVAILGDLCGPKIRIGEVAGEGVQLDPGRCVILQKQPVVADEDLTDKDAPIRLSTTFPELIDDAEVGQRLLINDGAVRMLIVDKSGQDKDLALVCHVTQGGLISSRKGINLPDTNILAPSLTDYDWQCVDWAVDMGIDFMALSFVRQADDIRLLKDRVAQLQGDVKPAIPVIAKIEKPQALKDIDAIVDIADGVMVARGDLGVEMDLAHVPVLQKRIIARCHDYGKPVIVATQMLQSMIESPIPTRAEASDVANAIFDGADAVMLSGETAVGLYPAQAIHQMVRIAAYAEEEISQTSFRSRRPPRILQESRYRTAALAHGVSVVVRDLQARFVVIWSQLGGGARYLSQNRLCVPIIAASSSEIALRQMCLMFGVLPQACKQPKSTDSWLLEMDRLLLEREWAKAGEPIVAVKGEPLGTAGVTNALRIHYVEDHRER